MSEIELPLMPSAEAVLRLVSAQPPVTWAMFVPGTAAPQGSKSFKGMMPNGRARMVESSKAVGPWRERIALAAHQSGAAMMPGAVAVDLRFVMPRPASTPKRSTPPAIKRPDVDKLARAVLDALTGILFADDSRVVDLRARKRLAEIGETTGVHIEITNLSSALDPASPATEH
jgi:Holliday junction resolvase RusA-like endonuclease